MSLALMKWFESTPQCYDVGMRVLTMGRLERIRTDVARLVSPGDRVLDVGCGTGTLTARLARSSGQVVGIDSAPGMLRIAQERLREELDLGSVTLLEMNALDVGEAFEKGQFNVIVVSFVLSELSEDERAYVLRELAGLLDPESILIVVDEARPDSAWQVAAFWAVRLFWSLLSLVFGSGRTYPLVQPAEELLTLGLCVTERREYVGGMLCLHVAQGKEVEPCLSMS